MRTAFIEELTRLAEVHSNLFLIVGDLGFSVVEPFADRFPTRFLNAGVAEQNMTGVAAGLASEGYHALTYSIANFPTFRCAEQIRNDVAYHRLPVTVVAVGGGLAYGNLGYSHHAVQDFALMGCMPHMLIVAPGDPHEVRACVRYLCSHPQPSYLRLGKAGEVSVRDTAPLVAPGSVCHFSGQAESKKIVLTTGSTLTLAAEVVRENSFGRDWAVASVPMWGIGYEASLARELSSYRTIVTLEEHLSYGGFGNFLRSAVDVASPHTNVIQLALDASVCGAVGSQGRLRAAGGLTAGKLLSTLEKCP